MTKLPIEQTGPASKSRIRVLILEDNPSDAELMVDELRRADLDPQWERVENEQDFVARLTPDVDLILSDYSLPQFNGVQALQLVRAHGLDVPFILVSGSIGEDIAVEAMRSGADDYLLKDRMARLGPAIRQALEQARLRREQRRAELALQASEERLRVFVEHAPAGIAMLDNDMRYLAVSRRWLTDYRLSVPDVIGRSHYDMFPEIPERWKEVHQRCLAGAVEKCEEDTFPRADGSVDWVKWEIHPWRRDSGDIGGVVLFAELITERKLQQQKIERLSRIRALSSGINATIVRARDSYELFEASCRIAVEHGHFGIAWIGTLDTKAQEITPIAWAGLGASEYLGNVKSTIGEDLPTGSGILAQAVRSQLPAFENDITRNPQTGGVRRQEAIRRGYRSAIILPLILEGAVTGILSLFAREQDFFNEDELKLLTELAANISFALKFISVQQGLREEQRLLHNLMDNIPDSIYFKDLEHRFVRLNKAQAQRYNLDRPEDAIGRTMKDFAPMDRAVKIEAEDIEILHTGQVVIDRILPPNKGAKDIRWISTTKAPIRDENGRITGLVGISRDVTARKIAEEGIGRLNRVYAVLSGINTLIVRASDRQELFNETCRIAVEHGKFGIAWIGIYDPATHIITPVAWAGAHAERIAKAKSSASNDMPFGAGVTGRAIVEGAPVFVNDLEAQSDIQAPRRQEVIRLGFRSSIGLPLMLDGAAVASLTLYSTEPNFFNSEELKLLTELASDISFALQAIHKQQRLDYLSYYDVLTGLPNRMLFQENLAQSLSTRKGDTSMVSVVLVDLERFRQVNDTLSWAGGDELLRQVANRLKATNSSAGRLGSNVFAVTVRGVRSINEITHVVEKILHDCFSEPFTFTEHELRVGCKAGVAMFPGDGADADTLLRNAEAALRRARTESERYVFYAPAMNARVAEIFAIENKLRLAVERQEFVLHYQPKLRLVDGRITSAEALIRWQDPAVGLVPPGKFIPVLEETGLIWEVGRWAIERALTDIALWRARGLTLLRVAVNVSPIQLRRKDFLDSMIDGIERAGDDPSALELEITEGVVMRDIEDSIRKLSVLRGMGIHISIDDFGTGYSSLSYMTRLPIDTLKIDRSFVIGLAESGDSATVASGIIALAHSLKLGVIAEGVETREQAARLLTMGCDEVQGYLYSKPVPVEAFEALLRAQQLPSGK